MPPQQCFISYAHEDHAVFLRLCVHIKALGHAFGFRIWHDQRITGGTRWNDRIRTEIENSQIFIALVTNDYLASEYIRDHELPAMIERYNKNNALILPIIYRESCWRAFFGSYMQVLPSRKGHVCPVSDWRPPEKGFGHAANAAGEAVQSWFGVGPTSPLAVVS